MAEKSLPERRRCRVSHPKVRTGCHTCKIRRVKCDEQKPACQRCQSTGRTCDGYQDTREWVVVVGTPSAVQVSDGFEDDQGRRCFQYFRSLSAIEFSRFFDNDFWGKLVLQATHSSAAVRHAVIALASLHKSFMSLTNPGGFKETVSSQGDSTFAAQEYGKAVSHLVQHISHGEQQGRETALICGILFISIEIFRGNDISALHHLNGCIEVLNEKYTDASSRKARGTSAASASAGCSDVEDQLIPMFARLDLEASVFLCLRPPKLHMPLSPHSMDSTCKMGPSSLGDASNSLNTIMIQAHHFIRQTADHYRYRSVGNIPITVYNSHQQLVSQLSQWYHAFNSLLHTTSSAQNQTPQATLLHVHYLTTLTMLSTCLHAEETPYDAFTPHFASIISLSASLMPVASPSDPKSKSFTLETGIIQPLYWSCIKSRSGSLRRLALSLLRQCSQEGVWVGAIQAAVAERVIQIEEGLPSTAPGDPGFETSGKECEDVSEWARIYSVGMTLDKVRRVVKMVCSMRLNGSDGEWDERVEWVGY